MSPYIRRELSMHLHFPFYRIHFFLTFIFWKRAVDAVFPVLKYLALAFPFLSHSFFFLTFIFWKKKQHEL